MLVKFLIIIKILHMFNAISCFSSADIDECALGIHKCGSNEKCINKDGGYLCQCLPGHMLKGDRCEDIDECERFKGRVSLLLFFTILNY